MEGYILFGMFAYCIVGAVIGYHIDEHYEYRYHFQLISAYVISCVVIGGIGFFWMSKVH